jgi:hypothetical protein
VLASQKPLRASPQGQHDENANGDVIGNEHGIPNRADCAESLSLMGIFPHNSHAYFGPATILNLYRIAHSESTVDKWDNSPSAQTVRARRTCWSAKALSYMSEPGRRSAAKLLSKDEARRIIAKLS